MVYGITENLPTKNWGQSTIDQSTCRLAQVTPIAQSNTSCEYRLLLSHNLVHKSLMASRFKTSLTNFHCITITKIVVLVAHRYRLRLTSIGDRFDPREQHPNFALDGYSFVLKTYYQGLCNQHWFWSNAWRFDG